METERSIPLEPAARFAVLVLCVATVLTAFVPRDLWTPDEQRYGQVAREILEGGDWLVLHLGSTPYAEKPPVYFWAETLVALPFGEVTSFTARLTGCLFAAGAFLLCFVLGRRWFRDETAGAVGALAFATNLLLLQNATRATMDLALVFFVLLTVERGSAWLRRGGTWRAVAMGLAWSAGTLTKGPMGALLPPLALLGEMVFLPRRPSWRALGWYLAPLVFVGATLAWALPAAQAGGDLYRHRLFGQVSSRVSGAEGHHVHDAFWYVGILAATTLPWLLHLMLGTFHAATFFVRPRDDRAGLAACAGAGVLGMTILFLAATKREVYLITPLPFLAIAAGAVVARHAYPKLLVPARGMLVVAPLGGLLLALALPFAGLKFLVAGQPWPEETFDVARFLHLLPAVLLFLLGTIWTWRDHTHGVKVALRVGMLLAVGALLVKAGLFPDIDRTKSFRGAARLAREVSGGRPVLIAGPIGHDWLWNLESRRLYRAEDLEALLQGLASETGPDVALVETSWWERELYVARRRDPALAERAEALVERGRARAEHRTYFVVTPGGE